jgi:hypothetical protein
MVNVKFHKKESRLVFKIDDTLAWEINADLNNNKDLILSVVRCDIDGMYTPLKAEIKESYKDGESFNDVALELFLGNCSFNDKAQIIMHTKDEKDEDQTTEPLLLTRDDVLQAL